MYCDEKKTALEDNTILIGYVIGQVAASLRLNVSAFATWEIGLEEVLGAIQFILPYSFP